MVPSSAGSVLLPDHPDVEGSSDGCHVVTSKLARPSVVDLVGCSLHPGELNESGLRLQGKESLDCLKSFGSMEDTGEVSYDKFEGNSESLRGGLVQLGPASLREVHQRVDTDGVMEGEGRASVDVKEHAPVRVVKPTRGNEDLAPIAPVSRDALYSSSPGVNCWVARGYQRESCGRHRQATLGKQVFLLIEVWLFGRDIRQHPLMLSSTPSLLLEAKG